MSCPHVSDIFAPTARGAWRTAYDTVLVMGGTLPASSALGAVPVETFYIGRTEVTWKDWKTVRTWAVANGYTDLENVGQGVDDNYPVTSVNWYDVVKWCNARSEKEGKEPVYIVGGAVYKTGQLDPDVLAVNGYRLPSAKEWEFAARGGSQTQGYTYSGSNDLNAVGWQGVFPSPYGDSRLNPYSPDYNPHPFEVGKKLANELGVFDMSGNVWEWTESSSSYTGFKIARGGCYYGDGWATCKVSVWSNESPYSRNTNWYGFRVALISPP
jgi:sulfatase modifying factor 1